MILLYFSKSLLFFAFLLNHARNKSTTSFDYTIQRISSSQQSLRDLSKNIINFNYCVRDHTLSTNIVTSTHHLFIIENTILAKQLFNFDVSFDNDVIATDFVIENAKQNSNANVDDEIAIANFIVRKTIFAKQSSNIEKKNLINDDSEKSDKFENNLKFVNQFIRKKKIDIAKKNRKDNTTKKDSNHYFYMKSLDLDYENYFKNDLTYRFIEVVDAAREFRFFHIVILRTLLESIVAINQKDRKIYTRSF